jgi:hypothetical protein
MQRFHALDAKWFDDSAHVQIIAPGEAGWRRDRLSSSSQFRLLPCNRLKALSEQLR